MPGFGPRVYRLVIRGVTYDSPMDTIYCKLGTFRVDNKHHHPKCDLKDSAHFAIASVDV